MTPLPSLKKEEARQASHHLPEHLWTDPKERCDCVICFEEIGPGQENLLQLGCSHLFHQHCFKPWMDKKDFCPICTKKITHIDYSENLTIEPESDDDMTNDELLLDRILPLFLITTSSLIAYGAYAIGRRCGY